MKRIYLLICLLGTLCFPAGAQSLTLEYNIGHGSYEMDEMKELLDNRILPVFNTVTTDKFPSYLTQDVRLGFEWKHHHVGALFTYMNTAGQKGASDYSGSCYYSLRTKGYKLGGFYRYRLADEKVGPFSFQPYLQLASGVVLNRMKEFDELSLKYAEGDGYKTEKRVSGTNLFVEPALGFKFVLCRFAALNVNISYEWDAVRRVQRSDYLSPLPVVDWSGYRAQAGILFYMNLRK